MDQETEINFHITRSFLSNQEECDSIKSSCLEEITKPNIKINITQNFLSDLELLSFLNNNHLNIFFYDDYNFYNGISSSIDFALSCKRPFAICKSNMFSHLHFIKDKILVETNLLKDIIALGTNSFEHYYQIWSNDNFIEKFEYDIKNYI
jgi:hypothetical protein